jgi:hypothetical protein
MKLDDKCDEYYRGQFGHHLVFETEQEKQKAMECLEKWLTWFCYTYTCIDDEVDERMYEYITDGITWIIRDPYPQEPKQIYTIAIRFKLYKRYIHEKPG